MSGRAVRLTAGTLLALAACGAAPELWAGEANRTALPTEHLRTVRELVIQHRGRHKPLDSFARETLEQITGAAQVDREDPVATVLSIMAEPERWQAAPFLSVPFRPLRERLGMDLKAPRISYNDLVASRKLMRMLPAIVEKQQRDEKLTMLEQETMDAFERFTSLSALLEQRLDLVPPAPETGDVVWGSILQAPGVPDERQAAFRTAWTAVIDAVRTGQGGRLDASARKLIALLRQANPAAYPAAWRLHLEVLYNHLAPFRIARLLYLIALVGLWLSCGGAKPRAVSAPPGAAARTVRKPLFAWAGCRGSTRAARSPRSRAESRDRPTRGVGGEGVRARAWGSIGMAALWVAFIIHGVGIVTRVVIGGRPPVSNFYETTLWLPFVAVALSLVFERVARVRYVGMAAAILAAVMLVLADHLPLDSSISPVVAVLRSNLWLTIHVLTVVASYGALALSTVLAHIHAGLFLSRRRHPALGSLERLLYRTMQVGIVLLAGGIMLGAVWANASWGRYWGWDPKETWALITLLWFLALLHGRHAGWLKGVGFTLGTIGGFFLLLMTYYGVSFYLVGLHSYAGGHAKPIPPLLIAYLAAEVAFIAVVGLAAAGRRARSPA